MSTATHDNNNNWRVPNLPEAPGLKALPAWLLYNVHFQVICRGMRLGLDFSALLFAAVRFHT